MNESKRVVLRVVLFSSFVLGLMLFLLETRSAGEAPERFSLFVASGPVTFASASIMVLALGAWVGLYLWERKRHLRHF